MLGLRSCRYILIGDTHGFLDDFRKQKEIIEQVNPEFVLCEKLENIRLTTKKDFRGILKRKRISDMTELEEIKKLITLCRRKGIKLIGIDLRNFGMSKAQRKLAKSRVRPTKKQERDFELLARKRELGQLRAIKRFKSSKPIVVVTGAWHLRDGSPIIKGIKSYVLVRPSVKGKVIFAPTKSTVKYSVRFSP